MPGNIKVEERLKELGYELDKIEVPAPKASYVPIVKSGNIIYTAGHVPYKPGTQSLMEGKFGTFTGAWTVEEGKKAAELIIVNILKNIKMSIGCLDKIERIIKLNGFVNCNGDFKEHSFVINGASDFLIKVFGPDIGSHARSAVGAPSLPFNVPVEIDMIVQFKEDFQQ